MPADDEIWTEIDYDEAWATADALDFHANFHGKDPAIREPSPSVTLSLAPIFDRSDPSAGSAR